MRRKKIRLRRLLRSSLYPKRRFVFGVEARNPLCGVVCHLGALCAGDEDVACAEGEDCDEDALAVLGSDGDFAGG